MQEMIGKQIHAIAHKRLRPGRQIEGDARILESCTTTLIQDKEQNGGDSR
jgi:hypothetical protein